MIVYKMDHQKRALTNKGESAVRNSDNAGSEIHVEEKWL